MVAILQLIGILVLGFLSSNLLAGRLKKRLIFVSGIEFLILGIILGPQVTGLMTTAVVRQLNPVVTLAVGALGLLYGLRFRGRQLTTIPGEYYRISVIEVLCTALIVGGLSAAALRYWFFPGDSWEAVSTTAVALAATAAVSAPTAIYAAHRQWGAKGPLTELLRFLISFGQFSGIVIFGILFCIFRVGQTQGIEVTRTEWIAINIGFGVILGGLFFLFLGSEKSDQRLLLALIGIIIFASGTAYFLRLSPLFLNLILGLVMGVSFSTRERLLRVLLAIEHPVYVLVMVFLGAAWTIDPSVPVTVLAALAAGYILLRYLGKWLGGLLAQRTSPDREKLPARLGLGLISQGAVAVAMAINFQQVYSHSMAAVVTTCVLMSVIFNEVVGQRLMRNLLVDSGELAADDGTPDGLLPASKGVV